jgi:hypothetical protein
MRKLLTNHHQLLPVGYTAINFQAPELVVLPVLSQTRSQLHLHALAQAQEHLKETLLHQ